MSAPPVVRLDDLFQQVVELAPPARAAEIELQCGTDPELRRQLEALLAHDRAAGERFLVREPPRWDDPVDLPGTMIGRYRITERIGSGGCGVVYAADPVDPPGRKVALKIIKLGMDTKEVVARFEGERQALALMDHPNIAQMYDTGATAGGRPYFVMEHVDGVPVTEYCDDQMLDVDQRLCLLIQVCNAIHHAHQRGIIHRDVKPSNILVELVDGRPVPKVIDFGIAKAMRGSLAERTLVTVQGELIGTPEYMSPEQADLAGVALDSTTDIYSLGVVLYELVAGVLPVDSETFHGKGLSEIREIICRSDTPKPSTRLRMLQADVRDPDVLSTDRDQDGSSRHGGDRLRNIVRSRRTDVRVLRHRLRHDLDWITMKAMEKDRTRRYASASELSTDLRRHLDHEPMLGRPSSIGYRLRKLAKRNRPIVASLAVAGLAFTIGVVVALVQVTRIDRETESANAINRFFTSMAAPGGSPAPCEMPPGLLGASAPEERVVPTAVRGFGIDVSVAELLHHASANVERSFAGRPELEARARETIGTTYHGLCLFEDARSQLNAALGIRRGLLGEQHPDTLRSKLQLGYSIWDAGGGEGAAALRLVRSAHEGMRRLHGPKDRRTLTAARILAKVLSDQGRPKASKH